MKATSPGFLARRVGVTLTAVAALFLGACTCQTGPAFRITAPAEGDTLSAEACKAVTVSVTPVAGDYCTFPPKAYEISVDGGASQTIPADKTPLAATFTNLATGPHTATAWAIGQNGKRRETASVKFTCAPPPPPPAAPPPPPPPPPAVVEEPIDKYIQDIFFDYDKSEIRPDSREKLDMAAGWMKKHPDAEFLLEGHCDERGTREYNLALGDRRANATKDYLASLGVDAAKLKTISYGKERPFVEGHDESAWSKNRRTHFVLTKK
ncbi:MAG TPA: peptidoglycan-associated lipoprotein Pal [Thermoanaerobaculia bacterium]